MGTQELIILAPCSLLPLVGIFFAGYAWGKSVGLKQGLNEAAKLRGPQ